MTSTLNGFAPRVLSILRMVSAAIFFLHGTQKIFGWPAAPQSGIPPINSIYGAAGLLELVGGILLFLGLFSRPVAFILSGQMAFAYWMAHAPRSVYPLLNGGDASILYCFVFFYIVFAGPGPWSVDALRGKR